MLVLYTTPAGEVIPARVDALHDPSGPYENANLTTIPQPGGVDYLREVYRDDGGRPHSWRPAPEGAALPWPDPEPAAPVPPPSGAEDEPAASP